jgi:uncharacterized membrane protein YfcA
LFFADRFVPGPQQLSFPMSDLLLVAMASALAGFIDAIVGGGGLVLTPSLFAVYPQAVPATLLGTNKSASVWGTAWSFTQYARRVSLNWRTLWPAVGAARVAAFAGAWAVTQVDPSGLKRALPLVLVVVLAYTLMRKDLGRTHRPRFVGRHEALAAAAVGAVVGFYDGFFGPGTGSFFVFLFVRVLGYDFLHASASAKLLNLATNVAALALFAPKGHVWWHVAPVLALANVGGSLLGTRLALRHGAGFVRVAFLAVVSLLIL